MFMLSFLQASKKDVTNFDKDFTSEKAVLTPTDRSMIDSINQSEFRGFSYCNPDYLSTWSHFSRVPISLPKRRAFIWTDITVLPVKIRLWPGTTRQAKSKLKKKERKNSCFIHQGPSQIADGAFVFHYRMTNNFFFIPFLSLRNFRHC